MAIVPGATSTGGNAAATSTVVNKPSGVTDGSVLVVGITINNSATVTPPAGWVEIGSPQAFTGAQGNLFLKVIADAGSEPSTYTFTLSGSQSSNNACQEFSGVDNASPLGSDVGVFNSSSLVTSLPMSSVTVALDGSLLVSNCSVNSSSRAFTAPSGWDTALEVTGFQAVAFSWRAVDAGATGTQSWTVSGSAESAAQMVALRPAATGPSAPTDPTSVVATTASTEATVTWVDGTGDPTPTWDTEYRVDGGSWTTSASDIAQGVQTRTQTGLTNGTLVRFRVRGQNTEGDSAWVESNDVTVGSVGSIPLEILDPTSSGNNTAGNPQNVAYPAHSVGDLIIQSIAIDANVTATVPTTGPNGETITAITTNVNPGTAGPRFSAWWWIATGAETAGNISVTLSAAEQTSSEAFRVPAGSFDPADPIPDISANGTQTSGTGTTITMPSFTATVEGGLVVAMGGVDADPMDATFSPAGWTDVITHDQGAVSSFVAQRDALTTVSETIAAASFGINTGDTASVIGFVIAPAPAETGTDTTGTPSTVTTVSAVGQATGTADPTGTSTAVSAVSAVAQADAQADPTGTGTVVTSVAAVGQAAAQTAATGTPTISVTVSATGQADADPTGTPSVVVAVSAVGQAASTIATTGAPSVVVTVSATGTAAATADPTGAPSTVTTVSAVGQATGPIPSAIQATGETDLWAGASGDIADDPWIWRNPAAPASSFILGVSKSAGSDGGVYTFDLDGTEIAHWLTVTINGVDGRDLSLYPGVDTDWDGRVLVLATDRTNDQLRFGFLASNGTITSAGTTSLAFEPYGCCLYVSPVDGAVYAFVSEATGGGDALRQHELTITGDTVTSTQVRSLDTASLAEGMACYDTGEWFFLGEEDAGLYRYDAEPDGGTSRTTVDTVAGNLTADVEGVTVLEPYGPDPGYLIVSSQGASDFQIYELASPHTYIATFEITAGTFESVDDCDGIHGHRAPFGSTYPNGLLVTHDATNPTASNYKISDLGDLFGPLPDLPANTTGTPTTVTTSAATGQADATADPTGTPTVIVTVTAAGQAEGQADPTGSPSVVTATAATGQADADADPTGTGSAIVVAAGIGPATAATGTTGTPTTITAVSAVAQADPDADTTGTATAITVASSSGQADAQADPTGTSSVVVTVSATGPALAATGTTGTPTVVVTASATGQADAAADPTGAPTAVTTVSATGQATGTTPTTGTPTVTGTVSATGTATATTDTTGTPTVTVTVSAVGQATAAATHPYTITIRDTGHTATIRDTGHTATIRDTGHTATIQETQQ